MEKAQERLEAVLRDVNASTIECQQLQENLQMSGRPLLPEGTFCVAGKSLHLDLPMLLLRFATAFLTDVL